MLETPIKRQKKQEGGFSDHEKPEIEHVEMAAIPEYKPGSSPKKSILKPGSLFKPWELYKHGVQSPSKTATNSRAELRKTMVQQTVADKVENNSAKNIPQPALMERDADDQQKEEPVQQAPVPGLVQAEPSKLAESRRGDPQPFPKTLANAHTELQSSVGRQIITDKMSDGNAHKMLQHLIMKQPTSVQQPGDGSQQGPCPPPPAMTADKQLLCSSIIRSPASAAPKVYFGTNAPYPRWVIIPVNQHLAQLTPQVRALGNLMWKFEAGPSSSWQGISYEQLYEYAYRWLEGAITDGFYREQLIFTFLNGPYAKLARGLAEPLPPLPGPPRTNFYSAKPISMNPSADASSFFYKTYERPSLAAREGMFIKDSGSPPQKVEKQGSFTGDKSPSHVDRFLDSINIGNARGANLPVKEVTLDDGREPAIGGGIKEDILDADTQEKHGHDLGEPEDELLIGTPAARWSDIAVLDLDDDDDDEEPQEITDKQGRGIRQRARTKRTNRFAPQRALLNLESRLEAPEPMEGPQKPVQKGRLPSEKELVEQARRRLRRDFDKHCPPRVNRRIRTWPGFIIPREVRESREMRELPDRPFEHRLFGLSSGALAAGAVDNVPVQTARRGQPTNANPAKPTRKSARTRGRR